MNNNNTPAALNIHHIQQGALRLAQMDLNDSLDFQL